MLERAECGHCRGEGRPVKGVVVLRHWRRRLAPGGCLSVCILIHDFAHQTQHTSDNVSNYDLARLR